jgi:CubicO group peptidase (beta-lactamase class C family)
MRRLDDRKPLRNRSRRIQRREFLRTSGRAALGLALLPLSACSRSTDKPTSDRSAPFSTLVADLEKQIPDWMVEHSTPALSIALISDAQIAWRRAFGVKDLVSRQPVDDDTVFEAGSVSKTVFAYAVLKLCERGVLDLDAPLTKYTPERLLDDPRLNLITTRRVLCHTTGLPNWRSDKEPMKISFTPGERWSYSGEGYSYLQSVVTHLTGHVDPEHCATFEQNLKVCATDIDSYMKANLLVPLGMTSSGYVWTDASDRFMALPHDDKGQNVFEKDDVCGGGAICVIRSPAHDGHRVREVPHRSDRSEASRRVPAKRRNPCGDAAATGAGYGQALVGPWMGHRAPGRGRHHHPLRRQPRVQGVHSGVGGPQVRLHHPDQQ